LAPADFWLFPKVKLVMKGDHHDTIQDIQRESTTVLNAIPQKYYSDYFQKLVNQFQLCIDSEGDYFEQKE
jgi:predicted transcriptional regulator